jgi:hypothetical protein
MRTRILLGNAAMHRVTRAGLAWALALATLPVNADVGRLFFTPQQRAELEKRRTAKVTEEQPIPQESAVTLNGYIRRSDGRTTTFVNGVPRYDTRAARADGRVAVSEPSGQVALKVGETADLAAGGVRDPLAGGSVRTPSAGAPR